MVKGFPLLDPWRELMKWLLLLCTGTLGGTLYNQMCDLTLDDKVDLIELDLKYDGLAACVFDDN